MAAATPSAVTARHYSFLCCMLAVACGRTAPYEPVPSQHVAFVADRDVLNHFEAYAVDVLNEADLEPVRVSMPLEPGMDVWGIKWSPAGDRFAYTAAPGLVMTDPDHAFDTVWTVSCSGEPSWSATERFLGCADIDSSTYRVIDATTGAVVGSVPFATPPYSSDVAWSPVEDRFVVRPAHAAGSPSQLFIAEPDGQLRPIQVPPMHHTQFVWSPGGEFVAIAGDDESKQKSLWIVATNPGAPPAARVVGPGKNAFSGFDWGGSLLFVRQKVVLSAIDPTTWPPVTSTVTDALSRGWWLSDDGSVLAYSSADKLTFASTRDGDISVLSSAALDDVGTVLLGPRGTYALVMSLSYPQYARYVSSRGGPVGYLGGAGEHVSGWALSPDGHRALLALAKDESSRLLLTDFETGASRTVIKTGSHGSVSLPQWVLPLRFSFQVDQSLYLGFATARKPIRLHGPYSNLRKLGLVAWQPRRRYR